MSIDLFKNDFENEFSTFMPLGWLSNGLISTPQNSKTAIIKSRNGIDLFKFLRRGIGAIAFGGTVIAGGNVSTIATPSTIGFTSAQHFKLLRDTNTETSTDGNFIGLITKDASPTIYNSYTSSSSDTNYISRYSTKLSGTNRTSSHSLPEDKTIPPTTFIQNLADLSLPPKISMQFIPTPEMKVRIIDIARVLDRIGNLVAYEGDEDEVVLEAGPRKNSLTILLQPLTTTAMYRTGSAYELSNLQVLTLAKKPRNDELETLVLSYAERHSNLI
jgi:hypothetical protein